MPSCNAWSSNMNGIGCNFPSLLSTCAFNEPTVIGHEAAFSKRAVITGPLWPRTHWECSGPLYLPLDVAT